MPSPLSLLKIAADSLYSLDGNLVKSLTASVPNCVMQNEVVRCARHRSYFNSVNLELVSLCGTVYAVLTPSPSRHAALCKITKLAKAWEFTPFRLQQHTLANLVHAAMALPLYETIHVSLGTAFYSPLGDTRSRGLVPLVPRPQVCLSLQTRQTPYWNFFY